MTLLFRCVNEGCPGNYSAKSLLPMYVLKPAPRYLDECPICKQIGIYYPKFKGKKAIGPDDMFMDIARKENEKLLRERLLKSLGGRGNVGMEQSKEDLLLQRMSL